MTTCRSTAPRPAAQLVAGLLVSVISLACSPAGRSGTGIDGEAGLDLMASRLCSDLAALGLDAITSRDFQDLRGATSELGRYMAQEVTSALARACADTPGAPRILDRQRVGEIVKERDFESWGLVPQEERRGGVSGGVDGLVTGKVTSFADELELSIQVIEYGSAGAVLTAETVRIPRTARHNELETRTLQVSRDEGVDVYDLRAPGPPFASWPPGPPERFVIELQGCGRVEDSVYCLFSARSVGQDRAFSIQADSPAVLADGTQVRAVQAYVGPFTATGPKGRVGDDLVQGVPTSVALRFTSIPSGARELLYLTLDFHGGDAVFEGVPIDRY